MEVPLAQAKELSAATPLQNPRRHVSSRCEIGVLAFAIFLKGGLLGAYLPFVSLWLSKRGYSPSNLGTVALVDALGVLFTPAIGALFDKLRAHNFGFVFLLCTLAGLKLAYLATGKSLIAVLVLTSLTSPLLRSCAGLLDAMALYSFEERGDFTRVRLVGDLGFGAIAVCVGVSVQLLHTADAVFWIFASVCGVLAVVWSVASPWMHCIRADARQMSRDEFCAQLQRLRSEVLTWDLIRSLGILMAIGACLGTISTFEFVLLDRLMGNGTIMGLCKLVGTVSAIPTWWYLVPVMDRIGLKNLQLINLFCAGLRLLILGLITNPWHALLSEALAGIGGFAAAYGSITVFMGRVVDEDMKGLAQSAIVICMGLGSGASPLLASFAVNAVGIQTMYIWASLSVAVLVGAVLVYDLLAGLVRAARPKVESPSV